MSRSVIIAGSPLTGQITNVSHGNEVRYGNPTRTIDTGRYQRGECPEPPEYLSYFASGAQIEMNGKTLEIFVRNPGTPEAMAAVFDLGYRLGFDRACGIPKDRFK